jgi:thiosulfate/3-mercaptopyruvate sulfurtransferase
MLAFASRRLIPPQNIRVLSSFRTLSTGMGRTSLLITPAALAEDLKKSPGNVKILDATWFMPNLVPPRNAYKEFLAGPRIKGVTGFWNGDEVADKSHPLGLSHMMPTPEQFAEACCR